MVALRGTDGTALTDASVNDWIANLGIAIGTGSSQIDDMIQLVGRAIARAVDPDGSKTVSQLTPAEFASGAKVTVVGHSLGGGLANLAAAYFGAD